MSNDPLHTYRIYKQTDMKHCSYATGDSLGHPLGQFEMIEVEMTEADFYQMVKDEREGRITFADIKEKYTKKE